jgi:hypothetical protein
MFDRALELAVRKHGNLTLSLERTPERTNEKGPGKYNVPKLNLIKDSKVQKSAIV